MRTTGSTYWLASLLALFLLVTAAPIATAAQSPHGSASAKTICMSCHNAHYAPYGPLLDTPNDDRNCYSCHTDGDGPAFDRATYMLSKHYDDQATGAPKVQPVEASPQIQVPGVRVILRRDLLRLERAQGGEPREDSSPDSPKGSDLQAEQVRKTCINCHNPHGRAVSAEKLLRAGTGQNSNGACVNCHPVAGKAKSFTSLATYNSSAHASSGSGVKWQGANYSRGECANCHDPHGTAFPNMLRKDGPELCYACHPKLDAASSLWPGDKVYRKSAHATNCLDCHNPHGSLDVKSGKPTPKLLVNRSEGAFCLACHKKIATQYALSTARMSGLKGMTSRHPADTPGSPVKCVDCHNPHVVRQKDAAGYEPTLSDPVKATKPFYWYQGNASGEFCLKCHDGSRPGAPNILAEIKDKAADNSGFTRVGDKVSLHNLHLTRYHKQKCSGCHSPHATEGTGGINRGKLLFDMQVNDYDGGYQGFESCETSCHTRRCASCHTLPSNGQSIRLR